MTDLREPLFGAAADRIRDQLREPTDLEVAISVDQQLSNSDNLMAVREALRLLLRALDAEPDAEGSGLVRTPGGDACERFSLNPAKRCPAARPEDPTPCGGPVVVTIVDKHNAGADGCEHHGARLLASLDGGRVYPMPDAPDGAAIRVFTAADTTRPFPWVDGPRIDPSQLSDAENRRRGEGQ